jgi:hypothetical protein
MEKELIRNLLTVAEAYSAKREVSFSTLGRQAAGDWRFFDHLREGAKTFTARKYDQVMVWFSNNWPDSVAWPEGIERPVQEVAS